MFRFNQTFKAHFALLSVSAIYGFFYVAVKLLLQELDQFQLIFMRLLLTALIVGAVEVLFFKTRFQNATDFFKTAGMGLLGVMGVQVLVVMGVFYTTAFHSSLLMSTIPIQTLLLSLLTRRESFHFKKLVGILLAFAGVALLLFIRHPSHPMPQNHLLGDFLVLLNALAFSWFLIGSQPLLKKYNSFSYMSYCYLTSSLVFFAGWGLAGLAGYKPLSLDFLLNLSPTAWWLLAYLVLFASIGTYTLNNYALFRTTPSTVAVYIFIQPVLSAILGYYLLNEPFSPEMAIAGFLTFSGVILASRAVPETTTSLL